jgi:biopolymer transport protein ExbD
MAEINSSSSPRLSTRVDMTPMVDLGFLLITFFILTASLSKPTMMQLAMPDKEQGIIDLMPVPAKQTVTLLLGNDQKIYLYQGILKENTPKKQLAYHAESLRKTMMTLKKSILQETGKDIIVIIKATKESTYKNVVDVFDEMAICQIDRYALVDISAKDVAFIGQK